MQPAKKNDKASAKTQNTSKPADLKAGKKDNQSNTKNTLLQKAHDHQEKKMNRIILKQMLKNPLQLRWKKN